MANSAIWSWLLRRRYLPQLFRLVEGSAAHHALELGCEEFLNDLKHVGLDAESTVSSRWAFFVRAGKFDLHP